MKSTDDFSWGGYVVQQVQFGEVESETSAIMDFEADGVVGMGFRGLARVTDPPLFAQLVEQHSECLVVHIAKWHLLQLP